MRIKSDMPLKEKYSYCPHTNGIRQRTCGRYTRALGIGEVTLEGKVLTAGSDTQTVVQ